MSSSMTGRAAASPVLTRPATHAAVSSPASSSPVSARLGWLEGGRAALAQVGGRPGGDQVAGQVEQPPQVLHPAGAHGQVPLPGQEPGQGVLFLVAADRDARGGARIGGAAGPVGPVPYRGPRVLGAEQDAEQAGVADLGRELDHRRRPGPAPPQARATARGPGTRRRPGLRSARSRGSSAGPS